MTPSNTEPHISDVGRLDAPLSSTVEVALQEALNAARSLISALQSENKQLRDVNLESQRTIKKLKESLTVRTRSDYKHARLSTLLGELERLQRATQKPQALQSFLPDATIARLARAVHEEQREPSRRERRNTNGQHCLQLLLGATLHCDDESAILIDMVNPDNKNRLAFELRWDQVHIEYTRKCAQFSGETPELAQEEGMHFEVSQGPHFLKELLNCMYPIKASPSQSPQHTEADTL